jgi:hypothetical protein
MQLTWSLKRLLIAVALASFALALNERPRHYRWYSINLQTCQFYSEQFGRVLDIVRVANFGVVPESSAARLSNVACRGFPWTSRIEYDVPAATVEEALEIRDGHKPSRVSAFFYRATVANVAALLAAVLVVLLVPLPTNLGANPRSD